MKIFRCPVCRYGFGRKYDVALGPGHLQQAVYISSISAWEIAMLAKKGRLVLTMDVEDWIARSEALPFIRFVPVDNRIAIHSLQLNGTLHNDPADRIIAATAIALCATLITKDQKLRDFSGVETIW